MKDKIIVLGAGGHAKVVIDIFNQMNETVDYCLGMENSDDQCLGISVLKGDDKLLLPQIYQQGYRKLFVAIGNNKIRVNLAINAIDLGFELINAISPRAIISTTVKLGVGIVVMPGAVINADTEVKDFAIINTGATIDHDCIIGNAAHIAPQCTLAGNVTIGDETFLGIGTKVIPGISIGCRSILGAGSVVIKDVDNDVTCVGMPANVINRE